eukprot:scpid58467/ scgid28166/ 
MCVLAWVTNQSHHHVTICPESQQKSDSSTNIVADQPVADEVPASSATAASAASTSIAIDRKIVSRLDRCRFPLGVYDGEHQRTSARTTVSAYHSRFCGDWPNTSLQALSYADEQPCQLSFL